MTCTLPNLVVLLLSTRTAQATENFPAALMDDLGVSDLPAPGQHCTLCHRSDVGGKGTVTQPFGMSMRDRGLVMYDEPSLSNAVAALTAEGTDSDNDGVGDIDEIIAGTSPNDGGSTQLPQYGCVQIVPGGGFGAMVGAMGLLALRRRRGPACPPSPKS